MFCTRCGKEIDYDSPICIECALAAREDAKAKEELKDEQDFNSSTPQFNFTRLQTDSEDKTDCLDPDFKDCADTGFSETLGGARSGFGNGTENPFRSADAPYTRAYTVETTNEPEPPKNRVMVGFGIALTAAILGFFSYIFTAIIMGVCIAAPETGAVLLFVFSVPATVMAIVFGAKSIGRFKRRHAENTLPIPALALGIAGVVFGAMSAFVVFISFITLTLA